MASLSAIPLRLEAAPNRHLPISNRDRCSQSRGHRPTTTPRPATHWGSARLQLATVRWLRRYVLCCGMGLWFLAGLPRLHAQPATPPEESSTPSPPPQAQPPVPAPGPSTDPPSADVTPPVVENIPPPAPRPPPSLDASAPSAPSTSDRTPAATRPRASLVPDIPVNPGPFRAGSLLTDGTLIGGTVTSYLPERSVTILTAFGSRSVIAWRDITRIQRFPDLLSPPHSAPAVIPSGGSSQKSGPRTTAVYLIFAGSLVLTIGGVIGTYALIDYVSKHPPSIHLWDLPAL